MSIMGCGYARKQIKIIMHDLKTANPCNFQQVIDDINSLLHQQIRKFVVADAREPYRFDKLEIDNLIHFANQGFGDTDFILQFLQIS